MEGWALVASPFLATWCKKSVNSIVRFTSLSISVWSISKVITNINSPRFDVNGYQVTPKSCPPARARVPKKGKNQMFKNDEWTIRDDSVPYLQSEVVNRSEEIISTFVGKRLIRISVSALLHLSLFPHKAAQPILPVSWSAFVTNDKRSRLTKIPIPNIISADIRSACLARNDLHRVVIILVTLLPSSNFRPQKLSDLLLCTIYVSSNMVTRSMGTWKACSTKTIFNIRESSICFSINTPDVASTIFSSVEMIHAMGKRHHTGNVAR